MPEIRITDQLQVSIDVALAPTSTLLQYAKQLRDMVLHGVSLDRLRFLTLSDPAVRSLHPQLQFGQPIHLGAAAPELTIRGDAGITFDVITETLFSPDEYGENIEIPAGQCYLALGIHAGVGAG